MRLVAYFFAGALGLFPVVAAAQSQSWRLTSFGNGRCLAKLAEDGTRTTLALERNPDGRIDLSLAGLHQANANEDPRGLLTLYEAKVTVSLNGKTRYTADFVKTSGWLELKDVGAERLRDLSPPGRLVFDVKGKNAQHETESFASPGLAPAIDFVTKCAGR